MEWKSPKDEMPPQGKKILYFSKGDVYVVQRFGKYWLPIPFYDSQYSFHEQPEFWADIALPGNFTGFMKIGMIENEGRSIKTIDELEIEYPDDYREVLKRQLIMWGIRTDK